MLELRAIRDIGPGEEICVDYIGDRSYLMARHQRRSLLRDTWGFDIGEELVGQEEEDVERRVLEQPLVVYLSVREVKNYSKALITYPKKKVSNSCQ